MFERHSISCVYVSMGASMNFLCLWEYLLALSVHVCLRKNTLVACVSTEASMSYVCEYQFVGVSISCVCVCVSL